MNRIGSEDWERLWGGRPPRLPRGVGRWLIALGAVVVLFILATVARGIYTEWLWFESVGFRSVYAKVIATKVVLFLLGGFSFFALLGGNILLARRLAPRWMNIILPVEELAGLRRLIVAGVVVGTAFLSLIFGSVAAGRWSLLLRYLNAQSFGEQDPIFSRDVSYYIFTLPTYRFFQGWLLGALVVTLLAVAAVYFIYFSLRRFDVPVTPAVKGHLSGLGAAILVLFAWGYWMDRFDLVHSTRGVVFGAGYTDIHAQWPALNLLTAIALLAAVLLIINIFRHGFMLPGIAIGLWIGSLVLLGNMYPAYVQRFQVQPNELGKENKYIDYNIALTRQAYGLNKIASQSFPAEVTPSATDIEKNPETINNIRLWDHRPLKDTYNQIQAIRLYYDFVDVDVDRYIIDGQKRQVMLSARELSPEKLSVAAQTWVNRYLQFTHGYGATMSPVNEVTTEAEGQPRLFIKDIPPAGSPSIQRPEIYYGETNTNYVIVNTKTEEFDYPRGDGNVYTRYQGEQGVKLSSFWRKLAYSWQFGDVNILISDQITSQSRLLYNRQIQERVRHIAPFLTLDSDPYLVVDSGRLFWIQDAYTTANKYPYSEPSGGLNYIRNSVKVVIDAYYGTTTFYIADPTDPILQTYASIFPRLFTPIEAMPPSLRAHIRYPQDLFTIQADLLRTYHMQDARVFYNKEDLWAFPTEVFTGAEQPLEPYYLIMRLPGEREAQFLLILPFTPTNKNNTIAWLAAGSDGQNYGKLVSYEFPKEKLIYGPLQIEARINQDTAVSAQFALWNQGGSRVIRGTLLMIPIEMSFLYVEPIFLQSAQGRIPELKRVIVASGERLAMEATLEEALAKVVGTTPPVVSPGPPAPTPPVVGPTGDLAQLIQSAQGHYTKAQEYLKAGDWAGYGDELKALASDLARLKDLIGQ